MNAKRIVLGTVVGLIAGALAGCGSDAGLAGVEGRVTLAGKPLPGAVVTFLPDQGGRPSMGTADEQGEFQMTTFVPGDGALVGSHRVTVTAVEEGLGPGDAAAANDELASLRESQQRPKEPQWLAPKRYANPETSGFRFEVQASGDNKLDIELVE